MDTTMKNMAPEAVASKKLVIIGVCGARGSFSEEAARAFAAQSDIFEPDFRYLVTAEAVLTAVEVGDISVGILPVANSIGGIVIESVYATAGHRYEVEKLFAIEIHQNILVKKGTRAEQVTQIVSHDQALKQCKGYLARVWPGVELVEYSDTAKAAEDLASGVLPPTSAVIASVAAAEIYDLDIYEASVNDLKTNFTTFIAVTPFTRTDAAHA